jgi:OmpA-OmpF porin, OOP family
MQYKSKVQKKYAILFAGVLAITSSIAEAADGVWLINPTVGYQWFDNDRQLDDNRLFGLGLEHHYNDTWGVELKYLDSNLDGDAGSIGADLGQLMFEGMYIVGKYNQFQPYLAAGLGHANLDYDVGNSNKETQATAGIGARYWLSDRWSAKTDLRMVHGIDDSDNDKLLTLAISYAFNKTETRKPTKQVAASTPEMLEPRPVDSDGDGVVDSVDKCPKTPYGTTVDNTGCTQKLVQNKTISLDVKFASGDDRITNNYLAEIEKIARFMQQYPTVNGTIEGHTDNVGASEYNKQLSQRRANAVRNVLVERFGVDGKRLKSVGYGKEMPIADNNTAGGRQLNRRVVAVFSAEVTK